MKDKLLFKKETIKSLIVILVYFILPYITGLLSNIKYIALVISILYFLALVFCYRKSFFNDFIEIRKNKKKSVIVILLGILLIFITTIILNIILEVAFSIKGTSENDNALKVIFNASPLLLIILTCIYYPIVEGIVFRKSVRDIIDNKWIFIIFSALFYFVFNIIYTSLSTYAIATSLCYFSTMVILSSIYYKSNNFTISVIILMIYNLIFSVLNFIW